MQNITEFTISHRNIGVRLDERGICHARLWAPFVQAANLEVEGRGTFPLQKKDFGYWALESSEIQAGDRYFFRLDGKERFPDPASLSQPDDVHKASEVKNPLAFSWEDTEWKSPKLSEMVLYELHIGTFTPGGTFDTAIEKLDYLQDLGINAIEVLPVSQFPGSRNWGYDGVYPFATQQTYGGVEAFQRFVQACHQRGIAVVLDVVYNHQGPEGNYLSQFGPYFTDKYNTPWGQAINFDDAWSDGVRHFYLENVLMWLRDFHVDGLRLDAIHAIYDRGAHHFLKELSQQVEALNAQDGKGHFLIGECDLNDTRYLTPYEQGGYGLDSQWCDEFHHALHAQLTGEEKGYYSDFGDISQLVKTFQGAYVYDGTYSPHRKKVFGSKSDDRPSHQFVVFTQNHDQTGNRMTGDRLTQLVDFESLKLAATAMLLSPYVPMLFMGEEYGEKNPFLYFISHLDEHLVKLVQEGRAREFGDFMEGDGPPDPQAETTFQASKLQWNYTENTRQTILLSLYKALIAFRKACPLFQFEDRKGLNVWQEPEKQAIWLSREEEGHNLLCLFNFGQEALEVKKTDMTASLPLIFDTAAIKWGGKVAEARDFSSTFEIQPRSAVVFYEG